MGWLELRGPCHDEPEFSFPPIVTVKFGFGIRITDHVALEALRCSWHQPG